MKPTVGRTVLYFPDDERVDIPQRSGPAHVWAAIITFVHERDRDSRGDEIGPWVVALHAFPPSPQKLPGMSSYEIVVDVARVPLAGMYDREELDKHPEWVGCWNWPRREPLE